MTALRVRMMKLDRLVPDPENARTHSTKNLEAIAKSLEHFGQRKPIVVARASDGSNRLVVIAGNGTLEAAASLGWSELAVAEVPEEWDADQARAYAIADNRTAELADWDQVRLASALVDLDAVGWDLGDLGFESLTPPDDPDVDDGLVPEAPADPVARVGDVWQVGPHRIVCGDSSEEWALNAAFGDVRVGCLLTDPPYGINLDTDYTKMTGSPRALLVGHAGHKYRPVANDDRPFDATQIYAFFSSVKEQFWFGADYYRRTIPDDDMSGSWLVWDKRNETSDEAFGSCFELLWSRQRHKRDMLRFYHMGAFGAEARGRVHPTQKPVGLLVDILTRWAPEGCVVADPFAGSGSSLLAAARSGRIGHGIELEPGYVDVIVKRLEAETGETGSRVSDA